MLESVLQAPIGMEQRSSAVFIAVTLVACGGTRDEDAVGGGPGGVPESDGGAGDDGGDDGTSDGGSEPDGEGDDGGGQPGDDGGGPTGGDGHTGDGGTTDDDDGYGGCEGGWTDPLPSMPDQNLFPAGSSWRVGPVPADYQNSSLEYQTVIPEGETTELPVVVTGDTGLRWQFETTAVVIHTSSADGHNPWLAQADEDVWCAPSCSLWKFVSPPALQAILEEVAENVRFDHKRVTFVAPFLMNDAFTLALETDMQPYFAGVAANGAEWQQATCSDVATPGDCPPEVFFAIGGCDDSFCPMYECTESLAQKGWDADIRMGTSLAACPCPPDPDRPHYEGSPPEAPLIDFLMTVSR